MGLPWKSISVTSLACAYLVTSLSPDRSISRLTAVFSTAWALQFLGWAIWSVFLWPKLFSPLRGLPEPSNNSLFMGQGPRIFAEHTGDPMLDWINAIPNNGLIRYLGLFNQERLLLTSPKALAEVLTTKNYDFHKPSQLRDTLGRILGNGILFAEDDEHKFQRKNLTPAFAFRHIKDLYPVFWSKSRESALAMTEKVLEDSTKEGKGDGPAAEGEAPKNTAVMEVANWASRATLDIIGVAGLGQDFGAINDPSNPINQTYTWLFQSSRQRRLLNLLGLFVPDAIVRRLPFKANKQVAEASQFLRDTCRDLVRQKRQAKLDSKGGPTDVDIISVAIESGGFTDENLVDQMMTFLAAGHETTATSLTWAIYMLCLHPEVQTRLREEVRANLPPLSGGSDDEGSDSSTVTSLDIDRIPYLTAVCNEVLRYYSPVPLTMRIAVRDTTILDQKVPQGTRVVLCPWAVNKSIELWGDDARRFDPERWLRPANRRQEKDLSSRGGGEKVDAAGGHSSSSSIGSGGATSNYAFMTFLHGPRSCIGAGFARAEFACLLAAWVGRFEFTLKNQEEMDEKNMKIKGLVTSRPADGLYVRAKIVEGW
ncbi:hypothetical protein VTK73DRAFT_5728 [Phialemonium thermophilum]|uniref:Cytochrome P450 n=1 Tax=Phialemonium thermophilum TaxID=223376 RepID=A0ABR3XY60_9PEZI